MDFFPGLKAMENYHPLFVHFPVVLLPLALVVQALALWQPRQDLERLALWLLWLGTVGAMAAAGTGLLAEEEVTVPEPAWEVIALHETLMLVTAGLAIVLSVVSLVLWWRGRWNRGPQKLLLAGLVVLCGILTVGADRGGQLVYQYGVSVQKAVEKNE